MMQRMCTVFVVQAVNASLSISQPVICINMGDSLLFDMGGNQSNYPVYDKDSLLNTNPNFDYGAFRALAETARSTSNITSFGFTFTDAGMYAFYVNGQPSLVTVVSVVGSGQSCPTDGAINPMTATVLVQLGVKRSSSIVVSPSWPVVISVLVGIVLVATVALLGVYWVQHSNWEGKPPRKIPPYKLAASKRPLTDWQSRGSITTPHVIADGNDGRRTLPKLFPQKALPSLEDRAGSVRVQSSVDAYLLLFDDFVCITLMLRTLLVALLLICACSTIPVS